MIRMVPSVTKQLLIPGMVVHLTDGRVALVIKITPEGDDDRVQLRDGAELRIEVAKDIQAVLGVVHIDDDDE